MVLIIGDGNWSKNHQKALKELEVDFCLLDIDSYFDLFNFNLDGFIGCIISCSTVNHFPILKFLLEKNIPVFCEKPVCLKEYQLTILKSFISKKPIFMSGHQLLFDENIREIKKHDNSIYINCMRTGAIPRTEGAVFSLAVHDVAIIHDIFNTSCLVPVEFEGNSHTARITLKDNSSDITKVADIFVQSISNIKLRNISVVDFNGNYKRLSIDNWSKTNLIKLELFHFINSINFNEYPKFNNLEKTCNVMDTIFKIINF